MMSRQGLAAKILFADLDLCGSTVREFAPVTKSLIFWPESRVVWGVFFAY